MSMAPTSSLINAISTFQYIVDPAGLFHQLLLLAIASKSEEMLNGLISTSLLKFSFLAKATMMDAEEEMLVTLINGYMRTTLLMKLVHLIKHLVMIMELDAVLKSSAKTVFQIKDVGLNNEQKFMVFKNTV